MRRPPLALVLVLALALGACSTVYYAAMYQLGWAKADLLANRVQQARDAMDQARIQFADALPDFAAARAATGGDRAARRQALAASYEDSTESGALIATRRAAVEHAGDALFDEWLREIAAGDPGQRGRRQQLYERFRPGYDRLLGAMRDAEASLAPVLDAMRAQLAAMAGGGATPATGVTAADGDRLLRHLQLAVALADQYVGELETID